MTAIYNYKYGSYNIKRLYEKKQGLERWLGVKSGQCSCREAWSWTPGTHFRLTVPTPRDPTPLLVF